MSSFEQFAGVVSSSEAGGDFGRGNVGLKHLNRVTLSRDFTAQGLCPFRPIQKMNQSDYLVTSICRNPKVHFATHFLGLSNFVWGH